MAIQGLRHTSNFEGNQRPQNWREAILLLNPNGMAPLTGLTSAMKSRSTNDPQFNWFEKVLPTQRFTLSANLAASGDLAVSSGALGLKAGHILRIEATGEIVRVSSDPVLDTAIPVVRGFSGSTAATVTIASENPAAHVIGTAHEEGSAAPTGINYDPTRRYNYTQIFRNTLEMTRTASRTRLRTGDAVKEAKRECLELHSIELEKAFFWGKAHETTLGGKPIRTTGGVISFIDSNNVVNNTDGSFTMTELEGWLKRIFDYGSTEKVAFAGNTAVLAINQCIRKNSSYNIQSGVKEYGMAVTRLICPFGELVIKTHPLFNQISSTSYNAADSSMTVLDMANVMYVNLDGADTKYQKDLAENGLDGEKSGYLTECGIEVHHPLSHFQINGMRSGLLDS
jgi:hypothetical protein